MSSGTHFRRVVEPCEGAMVRYQVATCGKCAWEARIKDSTNAGLPPEMVATKFRQRGWKIGQGVGNDACPKCAGSKRAPLSPKQKQAAFCRIAGVPRAAPKPKETTMAVTAKPTTEAPKQPTVLERRRVMDALEEHYDIKRGLYTKSWSDEGLATKLDVPRAWVSDIRQLMFGEGAGNEAAILRDEAIERVETSLKQVQDDILQRFGALETEVRKLKVERSYAG